MGLCLASFSLAAYAREDILQAVPNGLEFGTITASTDRQTPRAKIKFTITIKNIGQSTVTILTHNLQTELWQYTEHPKELHLTISSLPLENGKPIVPALSRFSPVVLKPGSAAAFEQTYSDRHRLQRVVLVYDMLNGVTEQYGTWRGRIRSAPIEIAERPK